MNWLIIAIISVLVGGVLLYASRNGLLYGPHTSAACKAAFNNPTAVYASEGDGGECWCETGEKRNGRPVWDACYNV